MISNRISQLQRQMLSLSGMQMLSIEQQLLLEIIEALSKLRTEMNAIKQSVNDVHNKIMEEKESEG